MVINKTSSAWNVVSYKEDTVIASWVKILMVVNGLIYTPATLKLLMTSTIKIKVLFIAGFTATNVNIISLCNK